MTQRTLPLKNNQRLRPATEEATAVGLSCENQVVTLRFLGQTSWGEAARQVRIDRTLAEQLARLLRDELEDSSWDMDLNDMRAVTA